MERVLTSSWVSSSVSFRGRPTPCWETALRSLESRGSNPPQLSLSAFPAGTAPLSACAEFSEGPVWKQGSRSRMNPGSYEFRVPYPGTLSWEHRHATPSHWPSPLGAGSFFRSSGVCGPPIYLETNSVSRDSTISFLSATLSKWLIKLNVFGWYSIYLDQVVGK